jgi:hypothetical protein
MFVCIVHPEVISLRIRIDHARRTDLPNLLQQRPVRQHRAAEVFPVLALPAGDHVVDRSEGVILVVEMAMEHGKGIISRRFGFATRDRGAVLKSADGMAVGRYDGIALLG